MARNIIATENRLEWEAWQGIVNALKNKGIDINNEDALVRAIKTWGTCYHKFRTTHGLERRD